MNLAPNAAFAHSILSSRDISLIIYSSNLPDVSQTFIMEITCRPTAEDPHIVIGQFLSILYLPLYLTNPRASEYFLFISDYVEVCAK